MEWELDFFFLLCVQWDQRRRWGRRNSSSKGSDLPQSEILQKYTTGLNYSCIGRAGSMVSLYPFATGFHGIFLAVIWSTKLVMQSSGFGQADLAEQEEWPGQSRMEGKLNWDLALSPSTGNKQWKLSGITKRQLKVGTGEEGSPRQCVSGSWF